MVSYPEMDEPIARAERLEARVAELEAALVRICEIGEFEDEPDEDQMLDALTDTRDAARAALFVSGPTDSVGDTHHDPPSDDGGWNDSTRAKIEAMKPTWDARPEAVKKLIDDAYEMGVFMGKIEAEEGGAKPFEDDPEKAWNESPHKAALDAKIAETLARGAERIQATIAREAARDSSDAACTCGSGGHPRRCVKHPEAYDAHVAAINAENAPDSNDAKCGAVDPPWPGTPPCDEAPNHRGSHGSSGPGGVYSWPNDALGAYSTCAYCGEIKEHTKRCGVTRLGFPEMRVPQDAKGPMSSRSSRDTNVIPMLVTIEQQDRDAAATLIDRCRHLTGPIVSAETAHAFAMHRRRVLKNAPDVDNPRAVTVNAVSDGHKRLIEQAKRAVRAWEEDPSSSYTESEINELFLRANSAVDAPNTPPEDWADGVDAAAGVVRSEAVRRGEKGYVGEVLLEVAKQLEGLAEHYPGRANPKSPATDYPPSAESERK